MSLLNAVMALVLAALTFAVFYLVIRMRDILSSLKMLGEAFPVTNEMRREAAATIASLNEKIGILNAKAGQINEVMNEIKGLRNLFIMPKGSGGAGERLLEKALGDILPKDSYRAQHRLRGGTVDFVIKFRDCVVPIDSKLSLEDFNRMLAAPDENSKKAHWRAFVAAVKKRIDETAKYIAPDEKTTDFAFMYIPSEGVYYEAFIKDKQFGEENTLVDYAMRRRVYPTSPQTIYPYLVTILEGMKALQIEENAREILNKVTGLRNDYERFKNIYSIIIGHLENAHSKHTNEATSAIAKLEQHISGLEHKKSG